jgi:hypothetical protein
MAQFVDFPEDLNLPAQAPQIVMSRIARIRRWPGVPAELACVPPAASTAAPANRAAWPA